MQEAFVFADTMAVNQPTSTEIAAIDATLRRDFKQADKLWKDAFESNGGSWVRAYQYSRDAGYERGRIRYGDLVFNDWWRHDYLGIPRSPPRASLSSLTNLPAKAKEENKVFGCGDIMSTKLGIRRRLGKKSYARLAG